MVTVSREQVLEHRLRAHHLDRAYEPGDLTAVVGAVGMQNTPPGNWELAVLNRIPGLSFDVLRQALGEDRQLLQAWSYRGVPLIFPAGQADTFMSELRAEPGEEWIYTQGILLALQYLHMSFEQVLKLVVNRAPILDGRLIEGKPGLDSLIAAAVEADLDEEQTLLWRGPSMYGADQTVGQAAVSFLLRPCSYMGLVVFGERRGQSPVFTSYKSLMGEALAKRREGPSLLVEKFLHCYGPSDSKLFAAWLGAGKAQAERLFQSAREEMQQVLLDGKKRFALKADMDALLGMPKVSGALHLLSPHDPYLDLRDRELILYKKRQRELWKTVANPGAVERDGLIIGIWRAKTAANKLTLSVTLWENRRAGDRERMEAWGRILCSQRGIKTLILQIEEKGEL